MYVTKCFGPKNLELFARGIENNQRTENFQRWAASIFFYLFDHNRCDIAI